MNSCTRGEPIAIIGIGCRYPGGEDVRALWSLLHEGRSGVTVIPESRPLIRAAYDPDPAAPGRMATRWGGFLNDIDQFDAAFFGIPAREAIQMSPRQRLLLEVAWQALEDADMPVRSLAGSRTGVFMASMNEDYGTLIFDAHPELIDAWSGAGNADALLANRLSYIFDLHGPSLTVDTACSGSLVAIHLAVQSLRSGESELALVGGVNIIIKPDGNIFFTKAGALSPDGECRAFDGRANGIVRSEGVGVCVLKPLSRALEDGDRIYALIRGTAVNSDGKTSGVMAPSQKAQEAVLRAAWSDAGADPAEARYVEAHGTGTPLGDITEARAIGAVIGAALPPGEVCALGSIKSNLGHTEAAAGVAGVIKVALAMVHDELPPSLHFEKASPQLSLEALHLRVQAGAGPWPQRSQYPGPKLAGVSAFGIGGTNAHLVLEEAPPAASRAMPPRAGHREFIPAEQWERERYWIDQLSRAGVSTQGARRSGDPLGTYLKPADPGAQDCWELSLDRNTLPFLRDHRVGETPIVPGAMFVFWALLAGERRLEATALSLGSVRFHRPLMLTDGGVRRVQVTLSAAGSDGLRVGIYSRKAGSKGEAPDWTLHASALLTPGTASSSQAADVPSLTAMKSLVAESGPGPGTDRETGAATGAGPGAATGPGTGAATGPGSGREERRGGDTMTHGVNAAGWLEVSPALHYADMAGRGLNYGPAFQAIGALWRSLEGAISRLVLPDSVSFDELAQPIHPVLLDAALQTAAALEPAGGPVRIPVGMHEFRWWGGATKDIWCYARPSSGERPHSADIWILGGDGAPLGLIEGLETQVLEASRAGAASAENWLYSLRWEEKSGTGAVSTGDEEAATESDARGGWLIFSDGELGVALARELERRGGEVTTILPATGFQGVGDRSYHLDPDRAEEFGRVLQAARDGFSVPCRGVIYLWSLMAEADPGTLDLEALKQAGRMGCHGLLNLIKGLGQAPWPVAPRIRLVTRAACPIELHGTALNIAQAPVWGMGRGLSLELDRFWGGLIDLDCQPSATDASAIVSELLATDGEDQVAYRGERRFVARLVSEPAGRPRSPLSLRPEATYLITGGLGALGLEVARWLADQGARRLILMGRTGLPPRSQWDTLASSAHASRIAAIQALEAAGVTILAAPVDSSNAQDLDRFLTGFDREGWPPIRGIVHCAGLTRDQLVTGMSHADLEAVLAPKVYGGWLLHRAFRDSPLDFFVLFSSVSALMPPPGQSNYAAANAFEDALAHYRRSLGLPALSINWGPWADVGMAASPKLRAHQAERGMGSIPPARGLELLKQLMEEDVVQRAVIPVDWERWFGAWTLAVPSMLRGFVDRASDPVSSQGDHIEVSRIREIADPEQRLEAMVALLSELLAQVMGGQPAELDRTRLLEAYDVDSIMMMELSARVKDHLGIALAAAEVMQDMSLEMMARRLNALLSEAT